MTTSSNANSMILKDLSSKRDLIKQYLQGMEKAVINYSALYEAGRDEGLAKIEELRAAYAPGSTNAEHQHENEKMYQASKEILGEKLPKMRDMVELLKKNLSEIETCIANPENSKERIEGLKGCELFCVYCMMAGHEEKTCASLHECLSQAP